MIKLRLYNNEEWEEAVRDWNTLPQVIESGKQFEQLLSDSAKAQGKDGLFRDDESVRLLKESYDITFPEDGDWYSIIYNGVRMPLHILSPELKFALTAIRFSQEGRYTAHKPTADHTWKILGEMPFDILIAARKIDIMCEARYVSTEDWHIHSPVAEAKTQWISQAVDGVDFLIENYPYMDRHIEVTAKESRLDKEDDFYTKIPWDRKNTPEDYLYIGRDGRYYMERYQLDDALQYFWKNDIGGIIEYIDSLSDDMICFAETSQTYNYYQMYDLVTQYRWNDKWCPYSVHRVEQVHQKGLIDDNVYEEIIAARKADGSYQKYVYFRDVFKVNVHFQKMPDSLESRKPPMLMVDRNQDGTYLIHGKLMGKYPNPEEILNDMAEMCSPDRERFAIIVDVEGLLNGPCDIDKTVYGFRIKENSLDIYDRYDAIRLFGAALKEAYNSGRCTISDAFY